ncbi:MAG TPA: flagellar biosynthetic protein FliQ [bacterium]|nr:flagellar biosynthetic protein FliQ [bacterium]
MNMEIVANIAQQALMTAWKVSFPVLLSGLVVGLLVSIFQAVTQIHEMTLTFIPKILVAVATVAVYWDDMLQAIVSFTVHMFSQWNSFLP